MIASVILGLAISTGCAHKTQAQENIANPSVPAQNAATTPASQRAVAFIEGQVTDDGGQPIPRAVIEWGYIYDPPEKLQRTTTDDHGRYRLDLRDYGVSFRLTASAPGRAPQWIVPVPGWQHLSVGKHPRDQDAIPPQKRDFQLEAEHLISGVVVDERGVPIQGVQVTAQTASEGFYSSFSSPSPSMRIPGKGVIGTTDAEGRFHLTGLPAKQVQLNFKSPHRHINDANYPVDQECRIKMIGSGQPGILRGRVMDRQTGQPIPAFTVVGRYDAKPRTFKTPDGRFEWKGNFTEGGSYLLYIYTEDYAPVELKTRALPLGSTKEDIAELSPGQPFRGQLLDAQNSKPLTGVHVLYGVSGDSSSFEWYDLDGYADGHYSLTSVQRAVTDDQGRFWFSESDNEPKGTLFILTTGYERLVLKPEERPSAVAGSQHIAIKLYPEAVITGVLLKDGQPQPNVWVSVWKENPRSRPEDVFESYPTDAQGKYRLTGLGPGTYQVSYWTAPSRGSAAPKRVETVSLVRGEHKKIAPRTMDKLDQPCERPPTQVRRTGKKIKTTS